MLNRIINTGVSLVLIGVPAYLLIMWFNATGQLNLWLLGAFILCGFVALVSTANNCNETPAETREEDDRGSQG